jgi:biotin synthase
MEGDTMNGIKSLPVWTRFAKKAIRGIPLTREEALAVLRAPDSETFSILSAAWRVRHNFHGRKVRIHVLQNAKSGSCTENCTFCSQSGRFPTPSERYPLQTVEALVEGSRKARAAGAYKYCMVTAGRSPSDGDLDVICLAAKRIKAEGPIRLCASLGILNLEKARRLAESGVDMFNHNLETSERFFENVVSSHAYGDRVRTVKTARTAGMEICSGGIVGLGETEEDVVDLCFALRELKAESVPVNFLDPRPGTPLEGRPLVKPLYALRVLSLFRLVHPEADVKVAGGREVTFRSLQPFSLFAATAIFTNGYLTVGGQAETDDLRMIRDAGFEPETES